MKESDLWRYVGGGLAGRWHATRIESSSGNGVPDVTFAIPSNIPGIKGTQGFLELKYIPKWPVKASTLVKLPLRAEQKLWISNRGKVAGNVWVLCRIDNDFFLFNDIQALHASEGRDVRWWFTSNFLYCCKHLDFKALLNILYEGYR